jgi:hypothetical protein
MATPVIEVLNVSCDPPQPKAGQPFKLTVTLDSAPSSDVLVKLEKQRIVNLQLVPTGENYFVLKKNPEPIPIEAGSSKGTSDPIAVRTDAKADDGKNTPVTFPDYLIFTAYIDKVQDGFVPIMVTIQKPHPLR